MTRADARYWAPVAESLRREECAKIIRTAPWQGRKKEARAVTSDASHRTRRLGSPSTAKRGP